MRDAAGAPGLAGPLLRVENVTKMFAGGVTALEGMALELHDGDFVSLLGPSGCGKSTALRLMAGLSRPTRGRIRWRDGADAGLGVVFQEPTLAPWSTVRDNVWLPLRLRGVSRRAATPAIEESLAAVGLAGFEGAYPRELSGGMKMRVSIARAMVTKPKLLLMDEPFAALDEITRFKLNDDVLRLQQNLGCTVVFVTHSVFESVFLSTRIVVMAARPGRVVEELRVDAPPARDDAFRTSAPYAEQCRRASATLKQAMEMGA
ncbi:MAG: ABC transporter ATP-binding protein [Alphaproteobacteria bacterium]|nr:ABC transporter ATP-binding protein [Alphaproteobacteria bacterium]